MAKLVALSDALSTVKKWAAQLKAITFEDNFQTQVQIANLTNGDALIYSNDSKKYRNSGSLFFDKVVETSVVNMNSTTPATLMSIDLEVEPTDVIEVEAIVNLSSGTASRYAGLLLNIEDTDSIRWTLLTAAITTADDKVVTHKRMVTGLSGKITVDLQWRTGAAATTIYAGARDLYVKKYPGGRTL